MNCVQSPSLEWENTGKRASRVITIRLRLISTRVTTWFMAPVSPASKLQISNTRERDWIGNRERGGERGRDSETRGRFERYISTIFLFALKPEEDFSNDDFAIAIKQLPFFLPLYVSGWMFIQGFSSLKTGTFVDKGSLHTMRWQKLLSTFLHAAGFLLCFFFFFWKVVGQQHNSVILDRNKWRECASC